MSVPVLSVQSTSIAPRFWIEFSRLTITFLRDMAMAPRDRQTETIIGSISGVRPTATAIAKKKASFQLCLVSPLMRNTSGTMTSMKRIISQVNRRHALVETRLHLLADDRPGHAAQIGPEARLDDHARGRAAFDAGAEEADVLEFQHRLGGRRLLARRTSRRAATRPVRLDWMTNRSLHDSDAEIGRDHVAGRQLDHVAGDQDGPAAVPWAGRRGPRWPSR